MINLSPALLWHISMELFGRNSSLGKCSNYSPNPKYDVTGCDEMLSK